MVNEVIKVIKKATQESKVEFTVEPSIDPKFGHYASNIAMRLAGVLKKSPLEIARELADRIKADDREGFFGKVEAAPPGFINFWLSKKTLHGQLTAIKKAGARWGASAATGATVVIDYSHPNIAKPMSVAHLRSTIIGQTLYNIFKFRGWKTIGDNHLGDWGKQFGILIAAYKNSPLKNRSSTTIQDLMALYVDYNQRMETDPNLDELARAEVKKLQSGDAENTKIWKKFYQISLKEFKNIYKILDVSFDYYLGESFYQPMLQGIVDEALAKDVATRSQGAVVINFENLGPAIIQKGDQAFLYATTDLAAIKYRVKKFQPNLILYVVDNGQSLHFEQVFAAARQLGFITDQNLVHVKFGMILGADMKKLSTRAGKHVALESVIITAIERARAVVDAKRPDLSERERLAIARQVGIGALKYNDLSQNRQSDIAFQWDKMMDLEGNSAPYLMYTYVRLNSILKKVKPGKINLGYLEQETDCALILKLIQFPDVLTKVTGSYFPHLLADYLYDLAKAANYFYQTEPVLKAEPSLKAARWQLVKAVAQTLKTGLGLLGIKALDKM